MKSRVILAVLLCSALAFGQSKMVSVGPGISQSDRVAGTITTNTSVLSVSTTGWSVVSVTINGTYAGVTVNFESTDDGTNWYATACTRTDAAIQETSEAVATNATRAWDCGVYGTTQFRVRASAYGSGTGNVGITLSGVHLEPAATVSVANADPCAGVKVFVPINQITNTKLFTGVAGKKWYVCSYNLVVASATNVALVEGSGSVCGTSTAGMAGGATAATGWNFAANGGISHGGFSSSVAATAATGNDVCILQSAANQISGTIVAVNY